MATNPEGTDESMPLANIEQLEHESGAGRTRDGYTGWVQPGCLSGSINLNILFNFILCL